MSFFNYFSKLRHKNNTTLFLSIIILRNCARPRVRDHSIDQGGTIVWTEAGLYRGLRQSYRRGGADGPALPTRISSRPTAIQKSSRRRVIRPVSTP